MLGAIGDSNVFDVAEQLVISLTAMGVVTIPLWFSQRNLHRKQDRLYEHVNNVEEAERVEGETPAKPTLGSLARETRARLESGFQDERQTHDEIKAELRREFRTQALALQAVVESLHEHGQRLDAQRQDIEAIRAAVRTNGENEVTP